MKQTLNITKKELREYFSSPVAYIVIGVFALMIGVYFSRNVFVDNQANLRKLFEFIPLIWIIIIPALTMRSFAEELKNGTLEVLMTLPVTKLQIIFGKFLSNLVIAFFMLLTTLPAFITVNYLGNPDIGQTATAYLGLLLVASVYIIIGLAISLNSKNQIIAFIISSFLLAILYLVGEEDVLKVIPARYHQIMEFIGLGAHFRSIARGVLDSRDVLYYISVMILTFMITLFSFNKIQNKGK
ncbi:MAG TPA: ABC transporter permease subunit [Candidatus Dojkabacteria bacterium]|mgnify:CR=1 FL=1|nr:ABC transporter permease subunit [Candidatus Dojkabacteria bacterium]HRO65546.1 ABC transporter permease subunit [Candidatus Dojkabacteria bacterium]HRP36586.1 ABC transporter permease subunit [Candidatus Dojkabacteria bacterium]HRP51697.1 ABC transporter permease subunit [Candidatus Dojkabacteria bacterium]